MMKRALLIGVGTIAGTAAVLAYHPGSLFGTGTNAVAGTALAAGSPAQAQAQAPVQASAPAADAQSQPAPLTDKAVSATKPASGTFTGSPVQTRYGPVQVQITVDSGKVTGALGQQGATDGRSQMIASVAIPQLQQQAVDAQSANINGVSGASYTSGGFAQSLQSALQQAGLS
jgi:uncharacterized protein with FMN-binding domain